MRMSGLFSQTLREAPADAEVQSHIFLLRAGFVRQLASGIFSYLPLARRALTKIEGLIRSEIDDIGGQEITMPVVHPADIWKETGRWYQIDAEMSRFKDRGDRDMVLAMTHEEVVADLVRREIKSYRQLPQLIYQIQTKWRDDPRPRSGLLRVREFTMKDSYSLDADAAGLEKQYRAHYQAYYNIFHRCGLPMRTVKADAGMMGGNLGHEFVYPTPIGEDTILLCDSCGYSANGQIAAFRKEAAEAEPPADQVRVATPDTPTIEALAQLLDIPKRKTAKALFVVGTFKDGDGADVDKLILAVIRGDLDVSDTKLANASGAAALRPAREEEISASGAVAGYASPMGLKDVVLIVDDSIPSSPNLVAGANEAGYHVRNVNYGRDFEAGTVVDIAAAAAGHACPECGDPLGVSRGVETGHIFQLGTKYSDTMGCQFLDQNGKAQPVIMGSYGIGVGRLLACIAEEHHDDDGLIWPISVAPFAVHIVSLAKGDGPAAEASQKLYGELKALGIEVLYDDRSENAGVKFKDADLIGVPVRITVGDRSLKQGNLEVSLRSAPKEKMDVPVDGIVQHVRDTIEQLQREINAGVVEVEYKE
jgi:prolyl-tRNA synthetase